MNKGLRGFVDKKIVRYTHAHIHAHIQYIYTHTSTHLGRALVVSLLLHHQPQHVPCLAAALVPRGIGGGIGCMGMYMCIEGIRGMYRRYKGKYCE